MKSSPLIYLHIGTFKTGTTSIQNFLFQNRDKLLDQGILYPLSGIRERNSIAHHNLPVELIKENRSHLSQEMYDINAGGWKELVEEIKRFQGEKVIISSEHFNRLVWEEIEKIKEYLSNYEVKIIVFLRRQDEYFISYYCQDVKIAHYWGNIKSYISKYKNEGNYYQKLEPWKQIFGKENIIVKVFKKTLKTNLIPGFLKIIDCKSEITKNKGMAVKNVTPSLKIIKIINVLNIIARGKLLLSKDTCRFFYLKSLLNPQHKARKIIEKIPNFVIKEQLLSEKEKQKIVKEFEQFNRQVSQEYLGQQNGQLFD